MKPEVEKGLYNQAILNQPGIEIAFGGKTVCTFCKTPTLYHAVGTSTGVCPMCSNIYGQGALPSKWAHRPKLGAFTPCLKEDFEQEEPEKVRFCECGAKIDPPKSMRKSSRSKVKYCERHRKMKPDVRKNSIRDDLIKAGKIVEKKKCKLCDEFFWRKPGMSDKMWDRRKYCDKHTGLSTTTRKRLEARIEAEKNPPPSKTCICGEVFNYDPSEMSLGNYNRTIYCKKHRDMNSAAKTKLHAEYHARVNPPNPKVCPCGEIFKFNPNEMSIAVYNKAVYCEKHRNMDKLNRGRDIHRCLVDNGTITDTRECCCGATITRKKGTTNREWRHQIYCDKHSNMNTYKKKKLRDKYDSSKTRA